MTLENRKNIIGVYITKEATTVYYDDVVVDSDPLRWAVGFRATLAGRKLDPLRRV